MTFYDIDQGFSNTGIEEAVFIRDRTPSCSIDWLRMTCISTTFIEVFLVTSPKVSAKATFLEKPGHRRASLPGHLNAGHHPG